MKIGRGGGIRTRDLLVPNQLRYQAALRPEQESIVLSEWAQTGVGAGSISCLDTATHC